MRVLREIRSRWRRHPILVVYAALNRIPFRPIQLEYYLRLELPSDSRTERGRNPRLFVRRADPDDLDGLARCQDKRPLFERRLAEGDRCILAMESDRVVGYEWFSERKRLVEERYGYTIEIPDDALYAYDAYVSETHRGRGIWREIVAEACDLVGQERRRRLVTHVDCANRVSIEAHRKVGFRPLARFLYVGIGGARFLIRMPMSPPSEPISR